MAGIFPLCGAMALLLAPPSAADKLPSARTGPEAAPEATPSNAITDPFGDDEESSSSPADVPDETKAEAGTASEPETAPADPATPAGPTAKAAAPSVSGPLAPPPSGAVLTATAAPPLKPIPIRWRLNVSLGVGATRISDNAFSGLSESRQALGAAPVVAFDWRIRPGGVLFIGGGLTYRNALRGGGIHDALNTEFALHEALAFARASLSLVEGLDLFADLGVGPSFVRIDVTASDESTTGSQRNALVVAEGAGGVALSLPKAWLPRKRASRVTGGLSASVGYALRNVLTVDPTLDRDDDAITTTSVPLGDVTLRGLSWRLGVFVRFM